MKDLKNSCLFSESLKQENSVALIYSLKRNHNYLLKIKFIQSMSTNRDNKYGVLDFRSISFPISTQYRKIFAGLIRII